MGSAPVVSIVVPARNEEAYLPRTLQCLRAQRTDLPYEIIVVDGRSTDATATIVAEAPGVRLVEGPGRGIAAARNLGARSGRGQWYAFVDADTRVLPRYVASMFEYVERTEVVAASSRCRVPGIRSSLVSGVINHVFPRLRRPILPGFNYWIERETFWAVGGFPDVPNEDTALSRRIARDHAVGYHPQVLVETSARRVRRSGLSGTLIHYLLLDLHRLRARRLSG